MELLSKLARMLGRGAREGSGLPALAPACEHGSTPDDPLEKGDSGGKTSQPAHDPRLLELNPRLKPLTRGERVVIVSVETPGLRKRVEARLRREGYQPRIVEPQVLFDLEPAFDANETVFLIVETGEDKAFLHRLARHIYERWSERCGGVFFCFWPSTYTDEDYFEMAKLDVESGGRKDRTHGFTSIKFLDSQKMEALDSLNSFMTCYP